MKYIMLTERTTNNKIIINLDFVDLFYTDKDGITCVGFYDGTYQTVEESVVDIYKMI